MRCQIWSQHTPYSGSVYATYATPLYVHNIIMLLWHQRLMHNFRHMKTIYLCRTMRLHVHCGSCSKEGLTHYCCLHSLLWRDIANSSRHFEICRPQFPDQNSNHGSKRGIKTCWSRSLADGTTQCDVVQMQVYTREACTCKQLTL